MRRSSEPLIRGEGRGRTGLSKAPLSHVATAGLPLGPWETHRETHARLPGPEGWTPGIQAVNFLDSNADPYYALLREKGVDMTFGIEVCDLNGGEFSIDPVVIGGNGMLDSLEMALITECYDNPNLDYRSTGGIWHDRVVEVYNHNYTQMAIDCGGEDGVINTALYGIPQMFAGLMTLGDTNSVVVPMVTTMALSSSLSENFSIVVNPITLSRYMPLPTFFGPDGDADGDSYINRQEYDYFVLLPVNFLYSFEVFRCICCPFLGPFLQTLDPRP